MSISIDELYEIGDTIYINEAGREYLLGELIDEWVDKYAYSSALIIAGVYKDEHTPEESLYYVRFEDDHIDQTMFELSTKEVSDVILKRPDKLKHQWAFEAANLPDDLPGIHSPLFDTSAKPLNSLIMAEIEASLNGFEKKGRELGALVDRKQKAYGNSVQQSYDVIKVFMKPYLNDDGTYTIPESLLLHLLLQVRIIDKQNRIFNNPGGDLMEENTYRDIAGYGMLGEHMTDHK
ncbi:hypothetical protein MKY96_32735 [Paenibacillus sp. FSL R7-0302]|uniref:hypothetical protein n=1 Tax=Paenibacillus sp. FSL R7-0302 TaxID=2921681 RepID=UPI0030FC996A